MCRLNVVLVLVGLVSNVAAQPDEDRAALEALYDATSGPRWTDSTKWRTAAPLGEWHGVTTDDGGRVVGLSLADNRLAGRIPAALGRLSNLEGLNLRGNELTGRIPAALGRLSNLEWLNLGGNKLTGRIPAALGRLSDLRGLYLYGNTLTGPVPTWLGSLSSLRMLYLGGNELTGRIPTALGRLSHLQGLSLQWNALTGRIPARLGSLTNLKWLYLGGNELRGPIPAALGRLSRLEELSLLWNALTGRIPAWLGSLTQLQMLDLEGNELRGRIPAALGRLSDLRWLYLGTNELRGPIPGALGRLPRLEVLSLRYNWGVAGRPPPGLRRSALKELDILVTQACAPAAWSAWLATLDFAGASLCGAGPAVTIDVAVVYTSAARVAAGGAAGIEAVIDLMIAETNEAYAASGVLHRLELVATQEVSYAYSMTGRGGLDVRRLVDPLDGYMDEVHPLRDRTGADLVHLIVEPDVGGIAAEPFPSAFGITCLRCGGLTFAHELGHNMGLEHDRYQVLHTEWERGAVSSHPAYGYVNQRAFETGAPTSSRWQTIMSYDTQCAEASFRCERLPRFSNPRQTVGGDRLGVPFGSSVSGLSGPADAVAVINVTGLAIAAWRDRPRGTNRPPAATGLLPGRALRLGGGPAVVDVSGVFALKRSAVRTEAESEPADGGEVLTASDGTRFRVETVVTGLDAPTSLDFAPDGRLFVAEQRGRVWVLQPGQSRPGLALAVGDPAGDGTQLLDLALDPEFQHNRFVYLHQAADRPRKSTPGSMLVRYREVGNTLSEAVVLLENLPTPVSLGGGRIRFGPDDLVYLALAGDPNEAQDLASYAGKLLRVRRDGAAAGGNPFSSPVYSLGHRQPAGFDWHPLTGALWVAEPGGAHGGEVNRVEAGGNYGWPLLEGHRSRPGMRPPDLRLQQRFLPAGASFYTGTTLAGFQNDLFVATVDGAQLVRIRFDRADPDRIVATEPLLEGVGRLRDVVTGPDGDLYVATGNRDAYWTATDDDDRIIRLTTVR